MSNLQTAGSGSSAPAWLIAMREKFAKGESWVFALAGTVKDYPQGTCPMDRYLHMCFASRHVVAQYNRATGITFRNPSHEELFKKLLGLDSGQDNLAAMAGIPGPASEDLPRDPISALALLDTLLRIREQPSYDESGAVVGKIPFRPMVILSMAELLVPPADIAHMSAEDRTALATIETWAQDSTISKSCVILLSSSAMGIHERLRDVTSGVSVLPVEIPDDSERLEFARQLAGATDSDGNRTCHELDSIGPEAFARICQGLTRRAMEDIVFSARLSGGAVTPELAKAKKRESIEQTFGGSLKLLDSEGAGFEKIGGHERVKAYIRRKVIEPIRRGDHYRVPMGLGMYGPSGTGKTEFARALAAECGLPVCQLDPTSFKSMYVGESNRRLAEILSFVNRLGGFVFIDEFDKAYPNVDSAGEGGSVDSEIAQQLMTFMSDEEHRGRVIFLIASNRPDKINPAFMRDGRIDSHLPFLAPSEEERAAILEIAIRRFVRHEYDEETIRGVSAEIAAKTDGYTGANLSSLARTAGEEVEDQDLSLGAAFEIALADFRAQTRAIAFQTRLAMQVCNKPSLLPPALAAETPEETARVIESEGRSLNEEL